jgi:hypothetical protein
MPSSSSDPSLHGLILESFEVPRDRTWVSALLRSRGQMWDLPAPNGTTLLLCTSPLAPSERPRPASLVQQYPAPSSELDPSIEFGVHAFYLLNFLTGCIDWAFVLRNPDSHNHSDARFAFSRDSRVLFGAYWGRSGVFAIDLERRQPIWWDRSINRTQSLVPSRFNKDLLVVRDDSSPSHVLSQRDGSRIDTLGRLVHVAYASPLSEHWVVQKAKYGPVCFLDGQRKLVGQTLLHDPGDRGCMLGNVFLPGGRVVLGQMGGPLRCFRLDGSLLWESEVIHTPNVWWCEPLGLIVANQFLSSPPDDRFMTTYAFVDPSTGRLVESRVYPHGMSMVANRYLVAPWYDLAIDVAADKQRLLVGEPLLD